MIKPYNYQLHNKVDDEKLLKNGFEKRGDIFYLKKSVHQHIYEELEISLIEKSLVYAVKNKNSDTYYAPFYHPEDYQNSEFCLNLYRKFNFMMDGLCKEGILWRPRRKPHYKKSYKKSGIKKQQNNQNRKQKYKNNTRIKKNENTHN